MDKDSKDSKDSKDIEDCSFDEALEVLLNPLKQSSK